jgi:hypothetical protein
MLNRRILAAAIATLGLAGGALAQSQDDVRQEDRRADRREDRRVDEKDNELEVRLAVPRKADGAIDLAKLEAQIRAALGGDVRETHLRIRERRLSAEERMQLADLARKIGADLDLDRVRIRQDGDRFRIDLKEEREHRADRREDMGRHGRHGHDRVARVDRPERHDRAERPERAERAERPERAGRPDRPDHSGRH